MTLLLSRFVWTIDFEPLDADAQASLRQLLAGQDICEGTLLTKDALAQVQPSPCSKATALAGSA